MSHNPHDDAKNNKDDTENDDTHVFRQALSDVKPLRPSKKHTSRPPRSTAFRPKQPATPEPPHVSHHNLSNPLDTSHIHAETCLSYGKHQLQHKQFKALKQGKISCDAQLDLHGLRLERASDVLVDFITQAQRDNQRCVLIIHGKGGRFGEAPVLKNHVNHWLKQLPEVLAFHSACACDGGYGALYVLLKR